MLEILGYDFGANLKLINGVKSCSKPVVPTYSAASLQIIATWSINASVHNPQILFILLADLAVGHITLKTPWMQLASAETSTPVFVNHLAILILSQLVVSVMQIKWLLKALLRPNLIGSVLRTPITLKIFA